MMSSAGKELARSNVLFFLLLIGSLYDVENNLYQKALRFL